MKKLLTIGATFLITSAVFYSCSLLKSLDEVQKSGFFCSNYSDDPVNEMNKQDVISMVKNYYQNQYKAINSTSPISGKLVYFPASMNVDSRVVFFSLDTLKRLIYNIEKATNQFSIQDKQNLGLNVYFISYPDQMKMNNWGYDYTNRHSLAIIPSIFDNVNHIGKDFDLNNSLTGVNLFSPLYIDSAFINNPLKTMIPGIYFKTMSTPGGSATMNSQNHGTATPPPPAPTGNALLDLTDPN
ncbi:hypothetical protein [Ferruginibacter sp.]|nr:hypothetical protein [Ferruginibacter sp.]